MKRAALALVDGLAPADQVAVVDFSANTYLQTDFSSDRELIRRGIDRVDVRQLLGDVGGSNIYQAVYLTAAKVFLGGREGRKAIVLLTDGQDSGLGLTLDPATAAPRPGQPNNRLTFEDLVEGETFEHWPGRTVGPEESRLHALRSLEINPRWHDAAYLQKYPKIAPGVFEPLVVGVVTALTTRTLGRVVANLGWTGIELPRPVRPGETIYAESTIGELRGSRSRPDQGVAQVETVGLGVGQAQVVPGDRLGPAVADPPGRVEREPVRSDPGRP